MGKVSIVLLLASTVVLLVAFGLGVNLVHGGDVFAHMKWAAVALVVSLGANVFTIFHAAQSDRIIRDLRAQLAALEADRPGA